MMMMMLVMMMVLASETYKRPVRGSKEHHFYLIRAKQHWSVQRTKQPNQPNYQTFNGISNK